jgi:hypothetical protein
MPARGNSCDPASWIRRLPDADGRRFSSLDNSRYRLIEGGARIEAISKLNTIPAYEASASEARSFGFTSLSQGLKVFVVRAVDFDIQGGAWRVETNGNGLNIEYGVLTRSEPIMRCQPMAVLLPSMPDQVFARASSAQ